VSEPLTELLHRYAGDVPVSLELLNPESHREAVFPAIRREREHLRESRRRSCDDLARILDTFDTVVPRRCCHRSSPRPLMCLLVVNDGEQIDPRADAVQ
jgi:hypothetical protein